MTQLKHNVICGTWLCTHVFFYFVVSYAHTKWIKLHAWKTPMTTSWGATTTSLTEFVQCPICLDDYDATRRVPRMLACQHSLCASDGKCLMTNGASLRNAILFGTNTMTECIYEWVPYNLVYQNIILLNFLNEHFHRHQTLKDTSKRDTDKRFLHETAERHRFDFFWFVECESAP